MKQLLLILILMLLAWFFYPRQLGVLSEVMKPDNISVFQDELYVAEGSSFYIYSLNNLQLIKKFGRKGEGPGEILSISNFPTRIHGFSEYILVEGLNKILFFSRSGQFKKEIRKPVGTTQMVPLGRNFVANRIIPSEDNRTVLSAIYLYNSDMELIKQCYSQKFVQQGIPPNLRLQMVSDFIHFRIHENKLFVEASPEGFIIEVFNENGHKLYQIKKNFKPIKVTEIFREQSISDLKEDPWVKPQIKALGGWEEIMKIAKLEFLDYFPAIQSLDISDGKLLVQTYQINQGKEEYIILDLNGNIENKIYVPRKSKVHLMPQIMGVKLYAIQDMKLYYVKEDLENEEWQLHVENIF